MQDLDIKHGWTHTFQKPCILQCMQTKSTLLYILHFCTLKHKTTYIKISWSGTPTCLDIFQGRVTAPRSHAVISIDLLMASKLISSYFSHLKWFWHRTVLLSTKAETWELLCVLHLSSWNLQTEHTQKTWFCALQCKETVKDTENI